MQDKLKALGYRVCTEVLNAKQFGLPQNRERLYIVCFKENINFAFPAQTNTSVKVGDILSKKNVDEKYTISNKLWEGHKRRKLQHKAKGNGFGYSLFNENSEYTSTISARYYKDGSEILIDQAELGKNPRKLTPRECANLQGFPKNFIVDAVSHGQKYKQFGNSVCTTVIEAVAKQMRNTMVEAEEVISSKNRKLKVA